MNKKTVTFFKGNQTRTVKEVESFVENLKCFREGIEIGDL